ncbi:MAG: phage holin family protein [Myxococcales bacterium]|nr:phage holin family protein [Myxococcales bacterium]
MFAYAVSLALGALAFLLVARILPGFEIRGGLKSAFVVALVYGVLKMILQKVLILVTLPMVVVSLGLFILVINAFLLWVTDKVLERFEIKSFGALVGGTLLLALFDFVARAVITGGTVF